jgi:hypothetical protein
MQTNVELYHKCVFRRLVQVVSINLLDLALNVLNVRIVYDFNNDYGSYAF